MCEYCRIVDISSYAGDSKIQTNYCPVCGERRKLMLETPPLNIAVNYISHELFNKLWDEMKYNLPAAIPSICKAAHIPPEYQDAVQELISEELSSVIAMLNCKDMFTILEPRNRWSSYANIFKEYPNAEI